MHTYIGMLEYCIKDKGVDHFEVVHNNVTNIELAVGFKEYVKHSISFAKNKIILTSKNLLERCTCHLKYKMHNQLGSSLQRIFLQILQTRTYILNIG